eukprot:TRINITY_DN7339_c0_g1_i2.p1 TRINITY_DN7339_c0_g1~~TRINITY_DN7339_c0_g1_i2.p1  ORF type:complete len:419 (+),score=79.64 TRINITY_DN7339_c0_g1_i2:548-1804(+)
MFLKVYQFLLLYRLIHPLPLSDGKASKKQRHYKQYESIVAHLEILTKGFDEEYTFLEFGCGKGELSSLTVRLSGSPHILVDRAKVRHAVERKKDVQKQRTSPLHPTTTTFTNTTTATIATTIATTTTPPPLSPLSSLPSPSPPPPPPPPSLLSPSPPSDNDIVKEGRSFPLVRRLRVDIADLNLSLVPRFPSHPDNLFKSVIFSKHLCGMATDLSLRCATKYSVDSILIALCCHHRCRWKSVVNKDFFRAIGFDSKNFAYLCKMSRYFPFLLLSFSIGPYLVKKEKQFVTFKTIYIFLFSLGFMIRSPINPKKVKYRLGFEITNFFMILIFQIHLHIFPFTLMSDCPNPFYPLMVSRHILLVFGGGNVWICCVTGDDNNHFNEFSFSHNLAGQCRRKSWRNLFVFNLIVLPRMRITGP